MSYKNASFQHYSDTLKVLELVSTCAFAVRRLTYLFSSQCSVCQIAEPRCPHGCVTGVNIEAHRFGDIIFKLGANQFEVNRY